MLQTAFLYTVHCLNRENTVSVRICEIGFSLFAGISTCAGRSKSSLISVFRCLFPWRFQNMFNADIWLFQVFSLPFSQVFPYLYTLSFSGQIANRQLFHDSQWLYNITKILLNNRNHATCTCPPDRINQCIWFVSPTHVIIDSGGINKGIWLVAPKCGITFW